MSLSQKLAREVERRKELENEVRVLSSSRAFLPRSEKGGEPNFSERYFHRLLSVVPGDSNWENIFSSGSPTSFGFPVKEHFHLVSSPMDLHGIMYFEETFRAS